MKKISRIVINTLLLCSITVMTATKSYAEPADVIAPDDDGFAETFDEADEKGILHEKPLSEMTLDELYAGGYKFYDGENYIFPESRAVQTGVLGYIYLDYTYNVRTNSGGVGTILGKLGYRDIIRVNSISGDFANVDFIASDGTTKTGYMLKSGIYTPAYGWISPTGTTGSITQYYGATDTNPSGHTGVDIGSVGNTTQVKAVNSGTATFKISTVSYNGKTYYAGYGRYVFLNTTAGSANKTVVYGHLSSLNGYNTPNYESEGYPGLGLTPLPIEQGTKNVSQGDILGVTGQTGLATGNHLHFEVRKDQTLTREDPFLYIVFPKITKA